MASTAAIARNEQGEIMGACFYPFCEVADVFVAEARACEKAVLFTLEMGFSRVVIEGDSLTIIKKL